MQKLNIKITNFVLLQILCGVAWIFVSNYLWVGLDPLFATVFPALHNGLKWLGFGGIFLAFVQFAIIVCSMAVLFIGTFVWINAGDYRRGIGMVALVMGIGVVFGTGARYMRPVSELDSIGYLMVFRAVLAVAVYFGMAVAAASNVLQWIARDELRDPTVKIRYSHSIPLCTILPVTHLFIGYVSTMSEQFIALAIGSTVLILFTVWTNRQRINAWSTLEFARQSEPVITRDSRRIGFDRTTQRL